MAEGDLTSSLIPVGLATYANEGDLTNYASGTAYDNELNAAPDIDRLIQLAEPDIDHACGQVWAPNPDGGRLWTPADLDPADAAGLARATCAQVLYRLEMGDEFFVRAQRERISGRAFSAEGKLPIVGPQAWRELEITSLVRRTTSTTGRRARPQKSAGWGDDPDFW